MITTGVGLAVSAARVWTRLYTLGLPPELCDRRRDEIESDLWESVQAGRTDARLAWQIWARLIGGLADDLGWRSEQVVGVAPLVFRLVATLGLITFLGLWLISAASPRIPEPPAAPRFPPLIDPPPPPPPPPPPCAPAGFPSAGSSPSDPGVKCQR
jgi:hypothetical protein